MNLQKSLTAVDFNLVIHSRTVNSTG